MPKSAKAIIEVAEQCYGNVKPKAILLTHGHFDHVGAIIELVEHWEVLVYAHANEIPYLTEKKHYPEPDPSVGGGLVARMSPFFPNKSISLGDIVQALPEDGSIPHLPDWEWIHNYLFSPNKNAFHSYLMECIFSLLIYFSLL
jgi:glyoxylase-like metal-dependent hydrolase (beta-lactamase superfamily II)